MFDSYKSRKITQISSLPDIQNEKSKVNVSAGISNFKTIYYGREWQLPISINVFSLTLSIDKLMFAIVLIFSNVEILCIV